MKKLEKEEGKLAKSVASLEKKTKNPGYIKQASAEQQRSDNAILAERKATLEKSRFVIASLKKVLSSKTK